MEQLYLPVDNQFRVEQGEENIPEEAHGLHALKVPDLLVRYGIYMPVLR